MKFYINEKEITSEEAHALKDKSGLIISEKAIKFKKPEVVDKTKGANKDAK